MTYIGIDCGVKTGVAVWDSQAREFLEVRTCPLYEALELCNDYRLRTPIHIVFEDARQRKWIPRETSESEYRGKLMGAGSVKRDAVIWQEFCEGHAIPFDALPPAKGMTKWSDDYFKRMTGWQGRTSNHARDAALLVWGRKDIR